MSVAAPPSSRLRCARCALPLPTCVCALVAPVVNDVAVLVLQHPAEAQEAKNSARLMGLSLARCRVVVGEAFAPDRLDELLHGEGRRSALLYPASETPSMHDGEPLAPTQLVVLDATWRKSLRLLMTHEALRRLPRVSLDAPATAIYAPLRKARHAAQRSTLEATCAALAALEDAPARYAPLLAAFHQFVDDRVARGVRRGRASEIPG